MSKARDGVEDLKTIDANLAAKASNTALAAKAPIASPTFTGTIAVGTGAISSIDNNSIVVGSGATNLRMIGTTGDIRPANANGSNSDNDIDLGDASARFKDLYLSGGVFLGGTGTVNNLSDYEQGTWTANAAQYSVGISTTGAYYRKVGTLVHVNIYLNIASTSATNGVLISGLPFAAAGTNNHSYLTGRSNQGAIICQVNSGGSAFDMRLVGSDANKTFANMSGSYILISGTYITA